MNRVFAIDPGTEKSAYVRFREGQVEGCGIVPNPEMELLCVSQSWPVACEWIESYGMAVGADVFETVFWTGRFHANSPSFIRVPRRVVKMYLCGTMKAKDANIRQRLIDMFPPEGGGRVPQVGTKKLPGPLYGVKSHIWSALAVAVTAAKWGEAAG